MWGLEGRSLWGDVSEAAWLWGWGQECLVGSIMTQEGRPLPWVWSPNGCWGGPGHWLCHLTAISVFPVNGCQWWEGEGMGREVRSREGVDRFGVGVARH